MGIAYYHVQDLISLVHSHHAFINCVLSLMLHKMSCHYQSVYAELTRALKIVFCVCRAFQSLPSSEDSIYRVHSGVKGKACESWVLTVLTRLMKEMLDGTSVNQAYSVTKGTLWIYSADRVHLVNIGKYLWVSIYRAGSANEGFSCFGILRSIELFVGSSRLRRWILIILRFILANLTI